MTERVRRRQPGLCHGHVSKPRGGEGRPEVSLSGRTDGHGFYRSMWYIRSLFSLSL